LGRGSPFNVSYQNCCKKKTIYVNDSQNLAFPTSHFVIELIKLLWNDPKLCTVIPTSNQDGRQAKNRKKGDEIIPLEMHFFVDSLLLVMQISPVVKMGNGIYFKFAGYVDLDMLHIFAI
jgi:hypothetical protein